MDFAKLPIERVSEVDMGITTVHYANPGSVIDAVTLCNITDWIGRDSQQKTTRKGVTCAHCLALAEIFICAAGLAKKAQGPEAHSTAAPEHDRK